MKCDRYALKYLIYFMLIFFHFFFEDMEIFDFTMRKKNSQSKRDILICIKKIYHCPPLTNDLLIDCINEKSSNFAFIFEKKRICC